MFRLRESRLTADRKVCWSSSTPRRASSDAFPTRTDCAHSQHNMVLIAALCALTGMRPPLTAATSRLATGSRRLVASAAAQQPPKLILTSSGLTTPTRALLFQHAQARVVAEYATIYCDARNRADVTIGNRLKALTWRVLAPPAGTFCERMAPTSARSWACLSSASTAQKTTRRRLSAR